MRRKSMMVALFIFIIVVMFFIFPRGCSEDATPAAPAGNQQSRSEFPQNH